MNFGECDELRSSFSPAVSRSITGCFRRNIGGVPVGREGVNSTIEKSYVIFFNPSPQKRLFLRCLPYIAGATQGRSLKSILMQK